MKPSMCDSPTLRTHFLAVLFIFNRGFLTTQLWNCAWNCHNLEILNWKKQHLRQQAMQYCLYKSVKILIFYLPFNSVRKIKKSKAAILDFMFDERNKLIIFHNDIFFLKKFLQQKNLKLIKFKRLVKGSLEAISNVLKWTPIWNPLILISMAQSFTLDSLWGFTSVSLSS